jgi:hypothetical protein
MKKIMYLGYGVLATHDEKFNRLMITDYCEDTLDAKWIPLTADVLKRINEFAATLPPLTGVEK